MRYSVSDTAEYGDLTRGPRVIDDRVRAQMKACSRRSSPVRSPASGSPNTPASRDSRAAAQAATRFERVGKELRALMRRETQAG